MRSLRKAVAKATGMHGVFGKSSAAAEGEEKEPQTDMIAGRVTANSPPQGSTRVRFLKVAAGLGMTA
jgi:hypothetical protein